MKKQRKLATSSENLLASTDLQIESPQQAEELKRALFDFLKMPPTDLMAARYCDYRGKKEAWTFWQIVSAYCFYPPNVAHFFSSDSQADISTRTILKGWAKSIISVLDDTCIYHPGRISAGQRFGKNFCQQCLTGIDNAVATVDKHVQPKECFVNYQGNDSWTAITGTGCAHWVAHQIASSKGSFSCLANCTVRVPDLISGMSTIPRPQVQVNDVWANSKLSHCGLVISVIPSADGASNTITIRHDSSRQGGVVDNDFDQFFKAQGSFYR